MVLSTDRKSIIERWYAEFQEDDDQISLNIDEVNEKHLKLSCGAGSIVFSLNTPKILISSEGSDAFVNSLVLRCKISSNKDHINASVSEPPNNILQEELCKVLANFSLISKEMVAESFNR